MKPVATPWSKPECVSDGLGDGDAGANTAVIAPTQVTTCNAPGTAPRRRMRRHQGINPRTRNTPRNHSRSVDERADGRWASIASGSQTWSGTMAADLPMAAENQQGDAVETIMPARWFAPPIDERGLFEQRGAIVESSVPVCGRAHPCSEHRARSPMRVVMKAFLPGAAGFVIPEADEQGRRSGRPAPSR